jgi:hypothetical protein
LNIETLALRARSQEKGSAIKLQTFDFSKPMIYSSEIQIGDELRSQINSDTPIFSTVQYLGQWHQKQNPWY